MARPAGFVTRDLVEVTSDEEGFRGAWFEATVVRSQPRLRRYTVAYDAIVDEADETRPLRETVDARHVRPRPPPPPVGGRGFELNQAVDARHNDAWWPGVLSRVPRGRRGRYVVYFPASKEEMEYGANDLRPHMDWVDGLWRLPETQNPPTAEFGEGTRVEVRSDEEGFHGAWFSATVIKTIEKKFLVEYHNLKTEDETEPLIETIDSWNIRPTPPDIPVAEHLKKFEEVDAFYNDGWWVGVISKVLEGQRYVVYFKHWKEEMMFGHAQLRLHHDWMEGRWIRASHGLYL